ncbi:MAG: flagellar motor protein MotD [Pseudomonadota bacterium]
MARKRYDESDHSAQENHERWLISYADFITLLFAFFVVMYAISSVNEGKYRVFSDALGEAFGAHASGARPDFVQALPMPSPALRRRAEAIRRDKERLTKLAGDLRATLAPLVAQGKVRVTQNGRGVVVEINASTLFEPGDATILPEAAASLRSVAALLRADPHAVQVEGHTDTTPINNALFPSNWELSAVRASSVVRLFVESGIGAARLSAVGHGDNMPVASNAQPEGRARNRRVAVTILAALPDPLPDLSGR